MQGCQRVCIPTRSELIPAKPQSAPRVEASRLSRLSPSPLSKGSGSHAPAWEPLRACVVGGMHSHAERGNESEGNCVVTSLAQLVVLLVPTLCAWEPLRVSSLGTGFAHLAPVTPAKPQSSLWWRHPGRPSCRLHHSARVAAGWQFPCLFPRPIGQTG